MVKVKGDGDGEGEGGQGEGGGVEEDELFSFLLSFLMCFSSVQIYDPN